MASLSAAAPVRLLPAVTRLSCRPSLSVSSDRASPRISLPQIKNQGSSSRRCLCRSLRVGYSTVSSPKCSASDPEQVKRAREDIKDLLKAKFCHPILVRLGWHDAGTYDKDIEDWPRKGGANGSLRFDFELKHAANAGLVNAVKLIQPIKDKYSGVTYADLFQLASATAIEEAGGPKIPMKYGRIDAYEPDEDGRLPGKVIVALGYLFAIASMVKSTSSV